jgi:hypothetical protein
MNELKRGEASRDRANNADESLYVVSHGGKVLGVHIELWVLKGILVKSGPSSGGKRIEVN